MADGLQDAEKDTYDIYSLLLTNTQTSHGPDNNPVYLITDTTVDGTPPVPCVTPPADRKAKFAEVMADFGTRKDERNRLLRQFNISKPYRYLSRAEGQNFLSGPMTMREATDLFSVGNVYFDRDRSIALTYRSSVCGGLCGKFTWRVFERNTDGRWQERRRVSCFAVA